MEIRQGTLLGRSLARFPVLPIWWQITLSRKGAKLLCESISEQRLAQ